MFIVTHYAKLHHILHRSSSKKNSTVPFALKRIKETPNREATIIAYHTLFSSHLGFGVVTWGAANTTGFKKIQILQKKPSEQWKRYNTLNTKPIFIKKQHSYTNSLYILQITSIILTFYAKMKPCQSGLLT